MQTSGSKIEKSIGVHASYNENSDSEDADYPLQVSKMKDLRYPAKRLQRSELNLDATLISEEDYHMVTEANILLHRQSSQNSQSLNDTTGSHTVHKRQH